MINLKIYTEENDADKEEVVKNVYDFDFDYSIGKLIIKYMEGEKYAVKLISTKNIKQFIGYEVN